MYVARNATLPAPRATAYHAKEEYLALQTYNQTIICPLAYNVDVSTHPIQKIATKLNSE